jgi:hypothetical protein
VGPRASIHLLPGPIRANGPIGGGTARPLGELVPGLPGLLPVGAGDKSPIEEGTRIDRRVIRVGGEGIFAAGPEVDWMPGVEGWVAILG